MPLAIEDLLGATPTWPRRCGPTARSRSASLSADAITSGGTVADLRRVAGSDDSILGEGWMKFGQALGRGVGPDALVGGDVLFLLMAPASMGNISSANQPASVAAAARWCDWAEKRSSSSRLMPCFAAMCSAAKPMPHSSNAQVSPS